SACFENVTGDVRILLRNAFEGVEHEHDDVRVRDRLQRLDDRELLDRLGHLTSPTNAGGVDQRVRFAGAVEVKVERVARGAGLGERENSLFAEQRVDQSRFADVGAPDDRYPDALRFI